LAGTWEPKSLFRKRELGIRHAQGWALSRLPEFGADAKKAIPRVQELLDDPQLYLRQAATNTLKKIDPDAAAKAGVK
jgi:HEAT repeat protein